MRLKKKYERKIVPKLIKEFGLKNKHEVPKIKKVVLNVGFGKLISGKTREEQEKIKNTILEDLAKITGQKPVVTTARKSISTFKLKKGSPQGAKVTLRGERMYDFLERLIKVTLPRLRDFKGIDQKCFDKKGNLTIGIKEHVAFPEISLEKVKFIFGLEVSCKVEAKRREQAISLFKEMGFPIKSEK
jgi:large subunit ribosomal protein L5